MNAKKAVMFAMSGHTGQKNRLSRAQLLRKVRSWGADLTDRSLRKTINELRKEGSLICSAGGARGGYWMAEDWNELRSFLNSEIRPRAMDLLETEKALKNAARDRWGEGFQMQLEL